MFNHLPVEFETSKGGCHIYFFPGLVVTVLPLLEKFNKQIPYSISRLRQGFHFTLNSIQVQTQLLKSTVELKSPSNVRGIRTVGDRSLSHFQRSHLAQIK